MFDTQNVNHGYTKMLFGMPTFNISAWVWVSALLLIPAFCQEAAGVSLACHSNGRSLLLVLTWSSGDFGNESVNGRSLSKMNILSVFIVFFFLRGMDKGFGFSINRIKSTASRGNLMTYFPN